MKEKNNLSLEQIIENIISDVFDRKFDELINSQEQVKETGLVKIEEASKFTGFKTSYIYELVRKDEIPYYKIKRAIRFDLNELNLWMREGQPKIIELGRKALKELEKNRKERKRK